MGDAARLIMLGDADVMVAGGAEAAVNPLGIAGFCASRALSTAFNDEPGAGLAGPGTSDRDGFVMGEGSAVVVLEEYEHAAAPFEKLVEELQPRRLQVNFLYQNAFVQPARLPDLELTPVETGSPGALFEWMAAAIEDAGGTTLSIEYNADLFDAATIDGVLASYEHLLAAVASADGPRNSRDPVAAGRARRAGRRVARRTTPPAGRQRAVDRALPRPGTARRVYAYPPRRRAASAGRRLATRACGRRGRNLRGRAPGKPLPNRRLGPSAARRQPGMARSHQ